MPGALTNRTPVTGDALPRAARLHAAAGHERHSCGELSAPWLSAPFAINILLFTTEVKQCIPFSPPCDCSYELKITFCVRGVIANPFGNYRSEPVRPGVRNQFNVGLQQRVGRHLSVDANYYWKFTDGAFDFDTLFNTPITFSVAWKKSKIDGLAM